jgi:hypothetical protein
LLAIKQRQPGAGFLAVECVAAPGRQSV